MPPRLIQRHDQFLKRLLDRPGTAGALLRERLPPAVANRLASGEPVAVAASFVPESLREHRSDRLFRVALTDGEAAYIYALVEHKSAPDSMINLQLLGYLAAFWQWWQNHDRCGPDRPRPRPPAVFPLVVYHGKAPWNLPTSFAETIAADPALRPHLLDFRYTLIDLGRIEDRDLSSQELLRVGLLILKHGSRDGDLRQTLLELGPAAVALGVNELVATVRYILHEPNEIENALLRDVVREIMPNQETRVMSLAAEQMIREASLIAHAEGTAEGEARGKARGEARGKAESLLRLLRRRFGPAAEARTPAILAAPVDRLELWLDNLLDAHTLDEVFQDGRTH